MTPLSLYPHQRDGIDFLKSSTSHALLWDEQRVGKTPQAIVASGELGLAKVLVVTTVAGVTVWKRQWLQWDRWGRTPVIIPWTQIERFIGQDWDLVINDESHYYKSFSAARTRNMYGELYGDRLTKKSVIVNAKRVWCLTGTPMPHDPSDIFPPLIALFPHVLKASHEFPDVSTPRKFIDRYCITRLKLVGRRYIEVKVGGKNEDELKRRIRGLYLRRRQKDVGIRPAIWDQFPIDTSDRVKAKLFGGIDPKKMAALVKANDWSEIQQHLATTRRLTGTYKAQFIAGAARDWLTVNESEKLVIAYWHKDAGDVLEAGLEKFRPQRVDGAVTGVTRDQRVAAFQNDPQCRVFFAQIQACGEAIDLSASAEMWFAESTFTPSQMAQMGARITNLNQPQQCLVRVATLTGSIDELVQDRLIDLASSIAKALGETYDENFSAV